MATKLNIDIDQGANVSFTIDVTDTNGNSIDLSTYTVASKLKRHWSSANSTAFIANGFSNGSVVLTMNAATTSNIAYGRHYYDVEITSASNTTTRVQEGIVTVHPEITK